MGFFRLGTHRTGWLTLLVAAVLSTSCGSGSDAPARTGSEHFSDGLAQTTASFRARTAEIKSDGTTALQTADQTKVLAVYRSLLAATEDAAKRYHQLTPPSSVKPEFESLLKSVDGQVDALGDVVSAAKKQDSKKVTESLRRYAALLVQYAADLSKLGGSAGLGAVNG